MNARWTYRLPVLTAGLWLAFVVVGEMLLLPSRPYRTVVVLGSMLLVLIGACYLVAQIAPRRGGYSSSGHHLLLAGELAFAVLIALGLLLGTFGMLDPGPAALAACLAALAMIVAGGSLWSRAHRCAGDPPNSKLLSIVLAGGGSPSRVASAPGLPFGGSSDRRRPRVSRRRLVATVLVLLLAALSVMVAVRSLVGPTYEYDALTYHLVFPAKWVQDGAISIIPTWFGDPAPAYAPSGIEVYYAWLMLATGDDRLARGGQCVSWLLLLLAAYVLGGEFRLRRVERLVACLTLALIPAINAQASTAMVDVAFAAQFVAVAAFALRTGRTRRAADAVGLLLACGLLLGTKFIALPYLAALSPLIVWALYRVVRRKGGPIAVGRQAAGATPDSGLPFGGSSRGVVVGQFGLIAGALVLACWIGGFWYVRNWIATGNPVYPLEVRLGSSVIFRGAYGRAQMDNSVFNVRRQTDRDALGRTLREAVHAPQTPEPPMNEQGFVPAYRHWYVRPLGLIAAGWLLALIAALRRSPTRTPRLLLFGCTALGFAVFWYVLPFQQPRFAWGPLALAVVGATAVTRLHRRAALIAIVLAAVAWISMFWGDWRLMEIVSVRGCLGTAAVLAAFLLWRSIAQAKANVLLATKAHDKLAVGFGRWRRLPSITLFAASSAVCVILAVVISTWAANAARSRAMAQPRWRFFRDAWMWVDESVHGATIAYAGNNVPYFLYGSRLENRVVHVPARSPADGQYHDFARRPETLALGPSNVSGPACDRYVMDPNVWLRNLKLLSVRYVFVSSLFPNLLPTYRHDEQGFLVEREWLDVLGEASAASERPFVQRRTFGGGNVLIYELHWDVPLPLNPPLRRAVQDETDALARRQHDGTPPGQPIRDYPHAGAFIQRNGLRPIGTRE